MPIAVMRNDGDKSDKIAKNARRFRAGPMKRPVRVALVGAAGRMGKTIVDLARNDPKIDIVSQCDLGDAIEPAMKKSDVVIDFSHPDAIEEICRVALQYRQPLIIGTTGHSTERRTVIKKTAES